MYWGGVGIGGQGWWWRHSPLASEGMVGWENSPTTGTGRLYRKHRLGLGASQSPGHAGDGEHPGLNHWHPTSHCPAPGSVFTKGGVGTDVRSVCSPFGAS